MDPEIRCEIEEMADAVEGSTRVLRKNDFRSPNPLAQQNLGRRDPSDYFLPQPTPCFDDIADEYADQMEDGLGEAASSDAIEGIFLSRDSAVPSNQMNSLLEKSTMVKDTNASITKQVKEFETARASLQPMKCSGITSPFSSKQMSVKTTSRGIQPQDAAPKLATKWNPVQMVTKKEGREDEAT